MSMTAESRAAHEAEHGVVIEVTTTDWYRREVERLVADGGTGYVWMSRWPHYGCGVRGGVEERETSCFTVQDDIDAEES